MRTQVLVDRTICMIISYFPSPNFLYFSLTQLIDHHSTSILCLKAMLFFVCSGAYLLPLVPSSSLRIRSMGVDLH